MREAEGNDLARELLCQRLTYRFTHQLRAVPRNCHGVGGLQRIAQQQAASLTSDLSVDSVAKLSKRRTCFELPQGYVRSLAHLRIYAHLILHRLRFDPSFENREALPRVGWRVRVRRPIGCGFVRLRGGERVIPPANDGGHALFENTR